GFSAHPQRHGFPTRRSSDLSARRKGCGIGNMALCKNYDEVLSLLMAAGLDIEGPLQIGTSKMVRCYMDGDRKKKQRTIFEVPIRSEEHTSELQSRENLVCRL